MQVENGKRRGRGCGNYGSAIMGMKVCLSESRYSGERSEKPEFLPLRSSHRICFKHLKHVELFRVTFAIWFYWSFLHFVTFLPFLFMSFVGIQCFSTNQNYCLVSAEHFTHKNKSYFGILDN